VAELPLSSAVIIATLLWCKVAATAAKVAVLEFAAGVIALGALTSFALNDSVISGPLDGADCESAIVQLALIPELIVAGVHCRLVTV
jgi:hypothetical protein